jgi:hypothetical protein
MSEVLIISSFGAQKNYPDQAMMRQTLEAFLGSLIRQSCPDWHLFIACHDQPDWAVKDKRIVWQSLSCEPTNELTVVPVNVPKCLSEEVGYTREAYGSSMTDMSRKTLASALAAGKFAFDRGLETIWMLRMDSDDMLALDHVEKLNGLEGAGFNAVFNRLCHMWDPRLRELAVHDYPFSTTCNAILMKLDGDVFFPDWFYLVDDHTRFMGRVQRDGLTWTEIDFSLCITTNSGNSISGRPEIAKEKNVELIPVEMEVLRRYGIRL